MDELIKLIKGRQKTIQIAVNCHEFLHDRFRKIWRTAMMLYLLVICTSAVLKYTDTNTSEDCSASPTLGSTIVTAISLLITGYLAKENPSKQAESHHQSQNAGEDLVGDLEIAITTTTNKQDMRRLIDIYEEKIKAFRSSEEPIPLWVKQKYIKSYNPNA